MIIALAMGSGRCGTQTFGAQMQRLRGVLGVHEGVHMAGNWHLGQNQVPHMICEAPGHETPAATQWNRRALELRREWVSGLPIEAYGEAAHYFALNMRLVEEIFPEARVVHLVRDPVSMVWSMLNHARKDIYGAQGKHRRSQGQWRWWGDCFPLWQGVTDRVSGFAWYWQYVNREIEKTKLPRLLVRTEELRSPETWRQILEFLGLGDRHVEMPHLTFNPTHPKRRGRSVPDGVKSVVRRICTWSPQ